MKHGGTDGPAPGAGTTPEGPDEVPFGKILLYFLRLGAIAVAGAFIGPSFLMVVAAGALYSAYSGTGIVQALFYGIGPAVMASSSSPPTSSSSSPTGPTGGSGRSAPPSSPSPPSPAPSPSP
ncbi:hypothetical protein SAT01_39390 [Sinomonas atrocyanea]|uniref:chromate transporter n=1 Tax=Sinomonas atrocyanea TaxID=37927 RepID=UPI001167190B|nr:chromate transporter [Sinomonas atrocyanea]GEB66491.1 hypothetical protein SAT01_39390 [Sinomonas atrocyanea]GGG80665.1 hypothetical protein GCM10007172_37450 [Sinomonas atrocyanea]